MQYTQQDSWLISMCNELVAARNKVDLAPWPPLRSFTRQCRIVHPPEIAIASTKRLWLWVEKSSNRLRVALYLWDSEPRILTRLVADRSSFDISNTYPTTLS